MAHRVQSDLGIMAATSLTDVDHALPAAQTREPAPCRLVGVLGEGGTARVYLARHEGTGRPVAVKRLHPELANTPHLRERLLAEADIVRSVRHDHVVNVLDVVSEPDGESYFIMEHLAGEPLAARIAREGALPLSDALIIAVQVAGALDAIHRRGIIHRDLKTENVLVSLDRHGRLRAKLIDFGVAEILGGDGSLVSPGVVGTPESMAPEQAIGRAVDLRCDIYSFGVLLYEMVTGGAPFRGDDVPVLLERVVSEAPLAPSQAPGASRQYVPPALERLILECLAKDPGERPQTMRAVRERLRAIGLDYVELSLAIERALGAVESAEMPAVEAPAVEVPAVVIRPRRPAAAVVDEKALAHSETVLMEDAWFEAGEQPATASSSWYAMAAMPRSGRLGRFAATALFIAAAATGLMALLGSSYSPLDLELPWFH